MRSSSTIRCRTAPAEAAVTDNDPAATDADRRAVAAAAGTSHAAFLGPGRTPDGGWPVRFFTATAELSGCGRGTGCLAAHLLDTTGSQTVAIEVEQGDTLGRPASVFASARRGPAGITTRVGGIAVVHGHRGDN